MQFLVYAPNFDPAAAAGAPSAEIMTPLRQVRNEAFQAGKLVTTGALPPNGKRLRLAEGKFTVTDGPFIELKELTGGFAVIQADSIEDAIEWSKRFRQIIGEGESEIVPILGPQ